MTIKEVSKKSLLYQIVIERFSKQFGVKNIIEIYVNTVDKVYAAT